MPIRHCQKCGLKVLIDESQTSANPFYCQRCAATSKPGSPPGPEPRATPPRRETRSAAASPPTAKGGPVKVLCPYCKASFSGRLPGKPAKGACPVCQKELVLLPDGSIRTAATFDLGAWQREQQSPRNAGDPPTTDSVQRALERAGTDEPVPDGSPHVDSDLSVPPLVEPMPESPSPREPEPAAEPTSIASAGTPDPFGGLSAHTMLDMGRPSDMDDLAKASRKGDAGDDPLHILGNEEPMRSSASSSEPDSEPEQPRHEVGIEEEPEPMVRREESAPPVQGRPVPIPAPSRVSAAESPRGAAAGEAGKPRWWRVPVAAAIAAIPLITGVVAIAMGDNPSINDVATRVGTIATRGLTQVHHRVTGEAVPPISQKPPEERPEPPPPDRSPQKLPEKPPQKPVEKPVEPPPPPPPPPTEDEVRRSLEADMNELNRQINVKRREIRSLTDNPAPEAKTRLAEEQQALESLEALLSTKQRSYTKKFGTTFKPQTQ